ncbi:MAG: hypothetical protein EAZ53_06385 [Bacteroidetes bacterium]|nr:MAG: hypothetical protein EAZ53_06385 [Bacteroidota bacterium]
MLFINILIILQSFYVNYAASYSKIISPAHACKSSLVLNEYKLELIPLKCTNLDILNVSYADIKLKKGVFDRKIIEIKIKDLSSVFIAFDTKENREEFTTSMKDFNVQTKTKFRFQYMVIGLIPFAFSAF